MATYTLVEIEIPEAEALSDLYGIEFDLNSVEELCTKAIESSKSNPRDYYLEDIFVSYAIIRYGRCFTKGTRIWLNDNDVKNIDPFLLERHHHYMQLRNKYIAHSVNAFEEVYVNTSVNKEGERLPIKYVSPGSTRTLLPAELAKDLQDLSSTIKNEITTRIGVEKQKLLDIVNKSYLDSIYEGQLHSSKINLRNVHTSRVRKSPIMRKAKH